MPNLANFSRIGKSLRKQLGKPPASAYVQNWFVKVRSKGNKVAAKYPYSRNSIQRCKVVSDEDKKATGLRSKMPDLKGNRSETRARRAALRGINSENGEWKSKVIA